MITLNEIPLDEVKNEVVSTPLFTDLSPYLSGDLKLERPSVTEMWDPETCLFYRGRVNEVHSEPGIGKTNTLIASVIPEIRKGQKVVYIDPEDTPLGFVIRMRCMGATCDEITKQVFYLHNPELAQILAAQAWAKQSSPSLVILDGMAESMAAQSMDEDRAQDVLPFLRKNVRPFADYGAAVVIADHVTKSKEGRGQFARGSGAKIGRYDGAVYEVVEGKSYNPGESGFVKLRIQKDRNGGVGSRGQIYAELHFIPDGEGRTVAEFRKPVEKSAEDQKRPTEIMDKIVKFLELHGEVNAGKFREIGGKSETNNKARQLLLEEGLIESRQMGNQVIYSLKKKSC
jgi:DNA-binding transcriptional ArsR family regulator